MNYIVLDLEFNQPFSFKTGKSYELNPECPFEIIQIGAVKLNNNFEFIEKFNYMIKPEFYKRIHPYVEKITGITEKDLENKCYFKEAFNAFLKFIGNEDSVLCTWGIDDIKSLYRNIVVHNINTELITNKYINVQSYATKYLNYEAGKTIGLKNAVTELNIEIESKFHDALNDADYTAKIFKIVKPNKISFDTFNIMDLIRKKSDKRIINNKALIDHFTKELGRELTCEEEKIIKKAYKLGRNQVYDSIYIKKAKSKKKNK